MSDFHTSLTEFLRLQQQEQAIAAGMPDSADLDDNPAWLAAINATQNAFDRLFALPAESGSQAAAKLAALASFYEVPGCGCDGKGWAMLVAEVARFSVGQSMARADDRAASATLVTAWELICGEMASVEDVSDQWERAEALILATPALSPAGVRAKLMVVLDQLLSLRWQKPPLAADDLAPLIARESELDFVPRMIVSAIQALEGMSS